MGHFKAIAGLLDGRFTSQEAGSATRAKSDKRFTLHDAIKIKLGTVPDWSVLAYSNSSDLNQAIDLTYAILTLVVGSRADVWATMADRTEVEVISALRAAEADPRSTDPLLDTLGRERPSIARIPGVGKPRAAIAATAAGISQSSGDPFGRVIQRALDEADDDTDSSIIRALDKSTALPPDQLDDPTLAIAFSRAVGTWFETSDSWKVSSFCRVISVDLNAVEDSQLLEHLIGSSPKRDG